MAFYITVFYEHISEQSRGWIGVPAELEGRKIKSPQSDRERDLYKRVGDAFVSINQTRKDEKVHGEVQSFQKNGPGITEDAVITQFMQDVESPCEC